MQDDVGMGAGASAECNMDEDSSLLHYHSNVEEVMCLLASLRYAAAESGLLSEFVVGCAAFCAHPVPVGKAQAEDIGCSISISTEFAQESWTVRHLTTISAATTSIAQEEAIEAVSDLCDANRLSPSEGRSSVSEFFHGSQTIPLSAFSECSCRV
jgi:hypothetical protein